MARILTIPAAQLKYGDVVIHALNGRDGERDILTKVERDPADGKIYITATCPKLEGFYEPWEHFTIDCDLTFKANQNLERMAEVTRNIETRDNS